MPTALSDLSPTDLDRVRGQIKRAFYSIVPSGMPCAGGKARDMLAYLHDLTKVRTATARLAIGYLPFVLTADEIVDLAEGRL